MKKFYLIMMATLLTVCGAVMAALVPTTETVSVPKSLEVEAGNTVSIPVSLDNTNENFVAFEMTINLPQGVTPVYNAKGKIAPAKTDRLDASHSMSCNYDEANNTIKVVCTSLDNEVITGTTGELFSFDLQTDASMKTGGYEVSLSDIVFTTSSTAPEGAVGYSFDMAVTTLAVSGAAEPEPEDESVTIHVQADEAPFLWAWNDDGNIFSESWPGIQMTDTEYVKGIRFWTYTFSKDIATPINIIFNNGSGSQTVDIKGIYHDRYYTYDGQYSYEDITDQFVSGGGIVIPAETEAFQMDGSKFGLSSSYSSINEGTTWYSGTHMIVSNAFTTDHRTVTCANNGYNTVLIGDTRFNAYNGVQGNENPKADGASPAETLTVPTSGAVVKIEALADGWIYIPAKLSTNKQYMVFEDGNAMGCKYAFEYTSGDGGSIAGEVKGEGANNYLAAGTAVPFIIDSSTKVNGLGVFYFKVRAGHKYHALAVGSKMIWCGVCYSSTEATSVKVADDYGNTIEIATAEPTIGEEKSEAYYELYNTILEARNILANAKITPKGENLLETAIAEAETALATEDDDTMTAATTALRQVIADVQANYTLISETISLRYSNGWKSWNGNEWINGQNASVLIAPGNDYYSYPESNSSYLNFYRGNTMTVRSADMPIVAIDFTGSINNNPFAASTGEMMSAKSWTGDTNEVTFTFTDTNYSNCTISSITVYYDNPDNAELVERIAAQIESSEAQIAALAYENVKGKAELLALIDEARALTAEADKEALKAALKNLKKQTAAVVALDQQYQALETLLQTTETTIQQNTNADATYVAEATAKIAEIRAGLAEGAYSAADIATLTEQMNRYNYLLAQVYLTIDVTEAGTLGFLILDRTANLTDVKGLRVSGKLNSTDLSTIKTLTNLIELNMAETNVTEFAESQFQNMTTLEKVVLPNGMTALNKSSFYGCTALKDVTLPPALRVINTSAFRNCKSLEKIDFPETLENISAYAFRCETTSTYVNGQYIYKGGSLKEITLPAALTKVGDYAFAYQTDLKKVTFADGLTQINRYAFYNCTALADLTLPTTLETIGEEAFCDCDALTRIELPEGVSTIEYYAFQSCDALQEVILPSTLQSINSPFESCSKLTKMTAKAIVPANANNSNIMGGKEAQCTLTVPRLSKAVYQLANKWSAFNIVTEDIMPENIYVNTDYRLTWPDSLSLDYRPNVYVGSVAALTVAGDATLSASNFVLNWDAYQARYNSKYDNISGNYYYNRDDCYAVLLNKAHVRADKVWINLKSRTNQWDFISVPFDIKVSDIVPVEDANTPFVIRKYDGDKRAQGLTGETWVNMTADSTLQAGQGYIWQSASTDAERDYNSFQLEALQTVNKNNLFANEDIDISLAYYESEFEHNRSWNFIGNPFPAYYDIRAIQTSAPITVWNAYNNNYQAYSPMDDAYILNPGQAFFLQRPVDQETVTFLKDGRQIDMEVRDVEDVTGVNRAPMIGTRNVFNLTLSGNEMNDRTRLVINPMAQLDYEAGHDASKFMSIEGESVQLYTMQNDVLFAINERPLLDGIVELGMQFTTSGTYTMALDTKVMNEVYLIDRLNGTETRIDGTEGYTFYAEQGTIEGRFALRFGDGETTGISNLNGNLDLNSDAPIYNLNGQRVNATTRGIYIQNGKKAVVK